MSASRVFRTDFLEREIERLGRLLRALLGRRTSTTAEEMEASLRDACEQLTGMTPAALARFDPEAVLALVGPRRMPLLLDILEAHEAAATERDPAIAALVDSLRVRLGRA